MGEVVPKFLHGGSRMARPAENNQGADLRDFLAAERTFLAWIRTGLALTGFGFVVARFGLFLEQVQVIQHAYPARSYGLSLWFGKALQRNHDRCTQSRISKVLIFLGNQHPAQGL